MDETEHAAKKSIKAKVWAAGSAVLTAVVGIVIASTTNILTGVGKEKLSELLKSSPAVQSINGQSGDAQALAKQLLTQNVDEAQIRQLDQAYEVCQDKINRSDIDLDDPIAKYEETVRCLAVDKGQGKILTILAGQQPELENVLRKLKPQE